MSDSHSASYAAAGVDVTAGYEAVRRIKPMVESTYIPGAMGTLGGFGGTTAVDRGTTAGTERSRYRRKRAAPMMRKEDDGCDRDVYVLIPLVLPKRIPS